ncbi:MAG: hypothetical protein ACI9HK_001062, partial [Pirellulaceae bacterium]
CRWDYPHSEILIAGAAAVKDQHRRAEREID